MKKMWICTSITAALLLSVFQAAAISPEDLAKAVTPEKKPAVEASIWMTNMEIAMQQAKKENKDILIDFTGSDWCSWCIKLDAEVFETPEFKAEAAKSYVLVKLDFPKAVPQTEAVKEYNQKWMEKFGVRGFPTIILTDASGKKIGQTGYQPGGGEKYIAHLKEVNDKGKARFEGLKKALELKGAEKAKALDKALSDLDDAQLMTSYSTEVDDIITLDTENKLGLKNKYAMKKTIAEIQGLMRPDSLEAAKAKIKQAMTELKPKGEDAQKLLFLQANVNMYSGDKEGAERSFNNSLGAAPDSELAPQIKQIIEAYFSPLAKRLTAINEMAKDPANQEGVKKALAEIDKTEKEMKMKDEERQQLLALKGEILMKKGDKKEARAALEAAFKAAPESRVAPRLKYTLDSM